MTESVQPQGNKLSFVFALSLAAGACVRVCLVRPPHAPSLRRCPQLSTLVRDHRGKSLCSREVGCLAKCPNQPKLPSLGGPAHGGSGGTFPSQIEGPGAWNSISPMMYAEGGREGREGTFP